jgi:histidine triad (HIT) family protein
MAKVKKTKINKGERKESQVTKSAKSIIKEKQLTTKQLPAECLFCKIAKGEIPCSKVYEDKEIIAFLDISPVAVGHTLIVPKKHSESMLEADEQTLESITKAMKKISLALVKSLGAEGINIVINTGRAAGQLIPHTHIHIVPRFKNDGQHLFNWKIGKYKEGVANQIAEKIKKVL